MSIRQWTYLSNHTHVLICIARNPDIRVRDIAELVGITERAVLRIIAELEAVGAIEHERIGRRNRYQVTPNNKLRHPLEAHVTLGQLLAVLLDGDKPSVPAPKSNARAGSRVRP